MSGYVSGPLFDAAGRDAILRDGLRDIEDTVGDHVLEMWRDTLDHNIRVNTGTYVSQTRVTRQDNAAVVNDGTSVYGPWLESTGSRNYPVTRFKGYRSAETTTHAAQDSADLLAESAVDEMVRRLNG